MKLGHWRSRPQQAEPAASQLVPALDRVREMREHSAWEPLTRPSTIQERMERVSSARRQIRIPPLAGERDAHGLEYPRRLWFREVFEALLVVIAGAPVIFLVWLALIAD